MKRGLFLIFAVMAAMLLIVSAPFAAIARPVATAQSLNMQPGLYLNTTIVNSSGSAGINTGILNSALGDTLSPQLQYALQTGPYAYALVDGNAAVIDTSTLKTVSTIKPDKKDGSIDAVAVSPDGKYIYIAVHWSEYYRESNFETYLDYINVVRLNASTLQPIDYFHYDYLMPRHLSVSPDGKVYLGVQQGGYPEHGGLRIMDFSQGKSWYMDYDQLIMIYNFEFSPDAKHAYYSAWWGCPKVYDFNTVENKVYQYWLTDNCSDDYSYVRTIALANGGKTLYAGIRGSNGIIAMNTADHGMKFITADYSPLALTASKDGNTIYALGYFTNSENKDVYFIHKYGGLQPIEAPYGGIGDILLSTKEAFTYDSMSYVTPPDGSFPINMDVSADGKFGFIATTDGQDAYNVGSGIIIYDLQYMNQVKVIGAKTSHNDLAVASEKIMFAPPVDYSWIKQFAAGGNIGAIGLLNSDIYVKQFYPAQNEFAKSYKEDYFELYADFTDNIDNATVSNSTFWLTEKSGANVPGRAIAASKMAMFMPFAQLKADTDYVAHLSKSIKSKDGKPLYADVEWNFTTKNTTGSGSVFSNSTLNLASISAISLGSAFKLVLANDSGNAANSSGSKFVFPQLRTESNGSLGERFANRTQWSPFLNQTGNGSQKNAGSGGQSNGGQQGSGQQSGGSQQAPPQQNGGGQVQQQGGNPEGAEINESTPSSNGSKTGTVGSQDAGNVKKSVEDAKKATQLNPQPEPPAPQKGFFEGIIDFIASLFGMGSSNVQH